jgi:uncharacterized membrane protein YqjE
MYGYEPPEPAKVGGCRDTLVIIRVAFEVIVPVALAGLGALAYIALTFWLFVAVGTLAGAVPIALVILAVVGLVLRDRRSLRDQQREANRDHYS